MNRPPFCVITGIVSRRAAAIRVAYSTTLLLQPLRYAGGALKENDSRASSKPPGNRLANCRTELMNVEKLWKPTKRPFVAKREALFFLSTLGS